MTTDLHFIPVELIVLTLKILVQRIAYYIGYVFFTAPKICRPKYVVFITAWYLVSFLYFVSISYISYWQMDRPTANVIPYLRIFFSNKVMEPLNIKKYHNLLLTVNQ